MSANDLLDWDDRRLDEAFQAAFSRTPPRTLGERIHQDLETQPRRQIAWTGIGLARLSGAGALLVAILVATASMAGLPRSLAGPGATSTDDRVPSASSPTPAGSPPVGTAGQRVWPFPGAVDTIGFGSLGVTSVEAAMGVRDSGIDSTELAVGGWVAQSSVVEFCTLEFRGRLGQLQKACNSRWLTPTPISFDQPIAPPPGPAIRAVTNWVPTEASVHTATGGAAVVFVGHFDDAVSSQCQQQSVAYCADGFVVDEVPWVLTTHTPAVVAAIAKLDVVSVADAIKVRDAGTASRVAVGGYFSAFIVPCPYQPGVVSPLEGCPASFAWLMANPEDLQTATDEPPSIHAPVGLAVNAVLEQTVLPPAFFNPASVVLVGHFNDPGATACTPANQGLCRQRFVVEAFYLIDDSMSRDGVPSTP